MKKFILVLLCIIPFLCSCSFLLANKDQNNSETSKHNLNIVTSFYPVYALSLNITKGVDSIHLKNMAQPQTGCLHDYELSTSDMKALSSANLFLINGGGMEQFLEKALNQYPTLNIANSSRNIDFLEINENHNEELDHSVHDHDEAINSHIWLSLDNALIQSENIKNELVKLDTDNEKQYETNLLTFKQKLIKLSDEYSNIDFKNMRVGIFHEGFEYFASEYHMDTKIAIYADENNSPSPKELSEAIDMVNEYNIKALFAADDAGKKIAETIAAETHAVVYILDPITFGNSDTDYYLNAMKHNLDILREALKNE